MKDAAVALLVAVAVLVIGAAVFFTTPSLQSRATRDAAQADLLAETARRQLGRYQPSLALVKAFLPDADWTAATAQLDPEAITRQVQDNARYIEQVDQVLRDLNTAYDAARSSVPQGSRDLMLAWGFPEPLIEDAFHFAGESGKRADQYRQRLRGDLPPTPDPRLSGLGAGPAQQSRALRDALQRVSAQYAANHKLLDDAADQLNQALRLLPNHVAANRLLAMVEFQRALQNRFEGLGLRRLAERYRPRLVELAATAQALKARADAVHNQRNIQLTLDQLDQPDRQLRARIDRQRDMVSQLQAELTARTQQVEALRAAARQARRDYEDALHASYDPDVPSAFADHLRNLQQAGRTMSAAAAQLEAAEQGTVVGVRLDPPGDLLAGRYLPAPGASQGEYLPGLAAISRQLAIEQTRLERTQAALQDLATRSGQLQQLRTHLADELDRYNSQLAALNTQTNEVLDDCRRLVAEAETAEAEGLSDHLEPALRHLKAARQGTAARMSDARTARTEAGRAQAPYLEMISQERWLAAGLEALEGEVLLLKASIHLQQANDLRSHRQALAAAARAGARETHLDAADEKLEDARFAAAQAAYHAAEKFNQALRSDSQWAYQANLGAALAMLTQIDPTNTQYRQKAAETLRSCLQGRQDTALTGWARVCTDRLAAMLAGLEEVPDENPPAPAGPDADS